jgi:thiamine-monophosphate kinase
LRFTTKARRELQGAFRCPLSLSAGHRSAEKSVWSSLCLCASVVGVNVLPVPLPEHQLIARLRRAAGKSPAVIRGIGDDAALLRPPAGHELLVTTDLSLEGVHFRREWHPPESVGHRVLARGLSDIAAMGGEPLAAFLSLAVPAETPQKWVDGFLAGFSRLACRFRVPLSGGDTGESREGIVADIVVVGSVPRGKALLRSGARPGDSIYVTGELGRSAAVLHRLQASENLGAPPFRHHLAKGGDVRRLTSPDLAPHFFPTPRLDAGRRLRDIASAAIDISDGLSTDLAHICEESGVAAVIHEHSIPRGVSFTGSSLHFALHGGEDYELLFTAPASARVPAKIPAKTGGVRVTRIGEVIRGSPKSKTPLFLADSHGQRKPLVPAGWQHFDG